MASIPSSATSSEQDPSPAPMLPQLAGSPIQSQSGGAPTEKQPTTEPSLLPEEMWLNIFQLLDRSSLDQVRLGCRCWNRIVGNTTSLMNKYVVRVNRWTINDRRELFNDAILASSSWFTTVWVCQIEIKNEEELDWWHAAWQKLGKTIQSLMFFHCRIPTNTLLDVLKETPNLNTLNYYAIKNFTTFEGASVDFQLNQLSRLVLRVDKHAETVNVFRKICPRLKQLYIFDESSTNEEAVVALVESVAHTLEDLQFDPTEDMLDKLCRVQLPHLKRLFLRGDHHPLIPEEKIVRFIKSCSTITTLDTSYVEIRSVALMHDLTVHLPNLTKFMLRTWPDSAAEQPCKFSFLRNIPHLEVLDVKNSDIHGPSDLLSHQQELSTLDLDGCQSPSLEKLDLTNHIIPKSALQTFLRSSPKIKAIWLFNCRLQASDIISMVSQLQSLEDLKLHSVEVNLDDFALLEHNMNPSKLKFLNIYGYKRVMLCSELLIALLMRCPDIKQLRLQGHKIEDSVLEVILRNLVHLERLKIDSCCFSKKRLKYFKANKCKSLKRIFLLKCSMQGES